MEALLPILFGVVGLTVAAVVGLRRRRTRMRAWREAAADAGLSEVRVVDELFGGSLEGRQNGLRVRLEGYRRGKYERGTRLTIRGLADLSARSEGVRTAIEKNLFGETEVELGSPEFDARCFLQSSSPLAFALLEPETRHDLVRVLRGHLPVDKWRSVGVRASLVDGVLRLECRDSLLASQNVSELLRGGLALARRLVAPEDIPPRIAENLRREPEPGVRLNALLTLAREFPGHPARREALLAARSDESNEVRLRAAMALGEEGRQTLRDLASSETVDDACAARAVAALGEQLAGKEAAALLRRALDSGRGRTAVACLEAVGERGSAASEQGMLAALRSPDDSVHLAAARALGRAGTVAAVRDLRAVSERGTRELRAVARQAVAEIQSRLAGAGPGQLSLAGHEAGALSLAGQETGALTLTETPEEPLAGEAPAAEQGATAERSAAACQRDADAPTLSPPVPPRGRERA